MDKKGRIFILEVNPNPDISLNAGYARALGAAGIDYKAFWKKLIEKALARKVKNMIRPMARSDKSRGDGPHRGHGLLPRPTKSASPRS